MTISEEIIKLVSGQYKVNIERELKVSVHTVQFVTNGQRMLERSTQARVCKYKVDISVKRAMKRISKEGSIVFTNKVCQLLPVKTSLSTILG